MGIFSIDKQICRQQTSDGKSIMEYRSIKPTNDLDFLNRNTYDEEGNVEIEVDNPKDYYTDFGDRINTTIPISDNKPFLEHHFENTSSKEDFLDHLKYGVLVVCEYLHIEVKEYVSKWVKAKRVTLQQPINSKATTWTHSQIALILVYRGELLNREKAKQVAVSYGHNSGNALYNEYSRYNKRVDRIGKPYPFTKLKLMNKIKLLESVLSELTPKQKDQASDEINILKNFLSEFE